MNEKRRTEDKLMWSKDLRKSQSGQLRLGASDIPASERACSARGNRLYAS